MATLSTDTCIRGNQSGLGTASDGEPYTTNGTFTASIAGNEAVIQGSNAFTNALLGTQTAKPINFLVRIEQNNSFLDGVGPIFRSDATGANCYFVALYNNSLLFGKLVSGGFASLVSPAFSSSLNTFYWIRVSMDSASHLQARIWQDGSGEPSTWNIDTSADATFTTAGRYGMIFNAFNSGTDTVQFDHITVTDGSSTTTNTRTIAATAALLATKTRTISATAALLQTKSRTIPDTVALLQTKTRTIPDTAALLLTSKRTLPATTALLQTKTRTIGASAALAKGRYIPCTAALLSTFQPNTTLIIPSGQTTLVVPSGQTTLIV